MRAPRLWGPDCADFDPGGWDSSRVDRSTDDEWEDVSADGDIAVDPFEVRPDSSLFSAPIQSLSLHRCLKALIKLVITDEREFPRFKGLYHEKVYIFI